MKRFFITIISLLFAFYGYCQERYMNAYSKLIPKKFANKTGTLDVSSSSGNLVLYLCNQIYEIFPEEWTGESETVTVIKYGKKNKLKKNELEEYDYLLINEKDGKYSITIRGGDFINIHAIGTKNADMYFKRFSSPSHSAHTSHYSSSK